MSRQSELAELSRVYDSSALSNRNFIINGAAVLDQRNGGSSVTASTGTYTLDRWRAYDNTDGVFTVQQVSDSPDDFSYSIKVTATTADSSLAAAQQAKLQQRIEGYNVASLALGSSGAKSLTLSFYVKSSVTGTYGVGFINSANDRSFVTSYTINSANTWEYKTITLAGDTTGTWLTTNGIGLNVQWSLGMGSNFEGTSGSWQAGEKSDASGFTKLIGTLNATWQITGVQLEVGDSATPFEHRSFGEEMAKCQRYYTVYSAGSGGGAMLCSNASDTYRRLMLVHAVKQRAGGTITATYNGGSGAGSLSQDYMSYVYINAGNTSDYINLDSLISDAEL